MLKKLLTGLVLMLWCALVYAQIPNDCGGGTVPAENCQGACINCNFNGYMGNTSGWSADTEPVDWCSDIQNDQWLGFIAGGSAATFTITPSGCSAGVQAAVYPAGCNDTHLGCSGGCASCGSTPTAFSVSGMIPGSNYYLIIDGYGGDNCNFTISVSPISAVQAPNVGVTPNIVGSNTACPGGTYTYSITNVTGAGFYTWTASVGGVLFNGEEGPVDLEAPSGRTVTVTFPPGVTGPITICVTPSNSCSDGMQKCKTVTVNNLPPTNLPKAFVCSNQVPFTLPWGTDVYTNGTYSNTYQNLGGCDSIVQQMVQILPPIFTNITRYVCEGGCYPICNNDYCTDGIHSEICTSYRNCDSTVNLTLKVLAPVANIIASTTVLSCTNTSIVLSSDASPNLPGASVKVWKNLTTGQMQAGATYTVTAPGTYILTTTMSAGGVQCIKADTIVITGNTAAPTVAGVNGVIGCGAGPAQIGVTTNASMPTFAWGGPGGFSSTAQSPFVNLPGTYTVTVTSGANGCMITTTATVGGNTTPPTVAASSATITCSQPNVAVVATSNTPSSYLWSGNIANDTLMVNSAGSYTVTVTDLANNCTSTAVALVGSNTTVPGGSASVSSPIGCGSPTVSLNANSATAGVTYQWAGPGLTGNGQTASANLAGTYTVTVTGTNGCTSTATVAVTGDTNLPFVSSTTANLNCTTPSDTLFASGSTGVTYGWSTGATTSSVIVNSAGTYTVTATAANGCSQTALAIVTGDFAAPNASATGAIIDCASTTVPINGASTTPGVTYSWTGPGGSVFNGQTANVGTTGTYILTVLAANGCTSTATAQVTPDANVPNISVQTDTITCLNTTATISGASSTPNVTYTWAGAGITPGNAGNPIQSLTQEGTYTLTINNPGNGCSAVATVVVIRDDSAPGVTTQSDTLTCAQSNLQLFANSAATTTTYAWTGPSFTSALQNPVVSTPGTYTVTATALNGCTSTAVSIVSADQGIPVLSGTAPILTCTTQSVTISTTASLPVTYAWTGPGFTSTAQNPVVSAPGTYMVTGTASNGCTAAASVVVNQDIAAPNAAAVGGTITCAAPSVTLNGSSTTTGATFLWTELAVGTSTTAVTAPGSYSLVVTGPNGCKSTVSASVNTNLEEPVIQINTPEVLTCANLSSTLETAVFANNNTVQSISWSNGATTEDPSVTIPGTFICTVVLSNGCSNTGSVTVTEDKVAPGATATGDILTCTTTSVNILAASPTQNVTYIWSNGLPAISNPIVNAAGSYTVTITGQNGCTSTAVAQVTNNTVLPTVAVASSNVLDCNLTEATLAATTTGGITYQWTGIGLSNETSNQVVVASPGTYTVVVTAANGCTSSTTFNQTENVATPNASATGGTIDCISGQVTLDGASVTAGVTYAWSGPGTPAFSSTNQDPVVTESGTYTLTVTGTNGCIQTVTAEVLANTQSPNAVIQGAGILTCGVTSIDLTGVTNTPNTTIEWTLPNNTNSTNSIVAATQPGVYTFEVTSTVNGCVSIETIDLGQNIVAPGNLLATGGTLDCDNPTITLAGSSDVTTATYSWTGPSGETYTGTTPEVSAPGDYTLIVTNPLNECTSTELVTVNANPALPSVEATVETITCTLPIVTLDATTNVANAIYTWTGPAQFTSSLSDPTTGVSGTYQLVVKDPGNGCTSTISIDVLENTTLPNVTTQNGQLTCAQPSTALQVSSTTANVSYEWTSPGGVTFPTQNPVVSQPGMYTVVVTSADNGCTSSANATVNPDQNIPVVTVTGGNITCAIVEIDLTGEANKPNVTWAWTGPNFTSAVQNPTITIPGTYTLVVTTPINGCTGQASVVVTEDRVLPVVNIANPDQLDCNTSQIGLSATVTTGGTPVFAWTTTNGTILSGASSSAPTVSQAGTYQVLVTNTTNGCTSIRTVDVTVDAAVPSAVALNVQDVSCFGFTNGSAIVGNVTGGTMPFSYSIDNQPFSASSSFTGLPPGEHLLKIMDANGCDLETTFDILEPAELLVNLGPDTLIRLGDQINVSLDNTVNFPDRVTSTVLTPAYLDTLLCATCAGSFIPPYSVQYKVTVVDSNGCRAEDTRSIIVDRTRRIYVPNFFTPTGAGDINNLLTVFGGNDVASIKAFQIYDRWGDAVHLARNFQPGDQTASWDGKINGKLANPAVFVYTVEVLFKDGETELFSGDVTISR